VPARWPCWVASPGGVVGLALAQVLGRALMSVALTLDNAPGQRVLSLSFGSDDFVLLLLGAVLVAVARVMVVAARAAEENRAFV
jgi:cell division protein FtsX